MTGSNPETIDEFEKEFINIIESDLTFDLAHHSPIIKSLLEKWQSTHPDKDYPIHVRLELVALDAMHTPRRERKKEEPYFRPVIKWYHPETDPPSTLIYPNVQGTLKDDQAIAYYQRRFIETE